MRLLIILLASLACAESSSSSSSSSLSAHSADKARECYSNKNIVFIGDSITRFQYLNLANALVTNDWRMRHLSFAEKPGWGGWKDFLQGSNMRLGCNEICDCYRISVMYKENRYFYDPLRNISISFFLWFPSSEKKIYLNHPPTAAEFDRRCNSWREMKSSIDNFTRTSHVSFKTIYSFIDGIVQPMNADAVIINQGMWSYDALRTPTGVADLSSALRKATKRYIWKTTTPSNKPKIVPIDGDNFMEMLRDNSFEIFDAFNLTKRFVGHDEAYSDENHFKNDVYTILNKALLKQLCPSV